MTPLLRSDRPVTLIGGGDVLAVDAAAAVALAPVVMAADGGADTALALGLMPDAVVGDFDSIGDAARAAIPAERLHRIAEQDSTDFDKCLRNIDAPFVLALGFAAPRMDHALAVLSTLCRRPHPSCVVVGAADVVFAAPSRLALDLPAGARLSLMPFGRVTGTSEGLRWPIDGVELAPAERVGTSNEVTGPVRLALDGPCLVILPKEHLPAALVALQ